MIDELGWDRENNKLSAEEREQGVDDLIALIAEVDGRLQSQSLADVA